MEQIRLTVQMWILRLKVKVLSHLILLQVLWITLNQKGLILHSLIVQKIAQQDGINNYKGTPEQNTSLLKKLQSVAKPAQQTKPKPKGDMKTTSVVDYLKSINVDSSMTNRKKLAVKYEVKNYRGTGAQNTQLLKKLRA